MSFTEEERRGFRAATRDDQLDSEDQFVSDVLNGDYNTYLNDDELEELMNAEDDAEEESSLPDADAVLTREVVRECEGVDEHGHPKSAIGLTLSMIDTRLEDLDNSPGKTLAQQSLVKPVVTINKRFEFIEILLDFPSQADTELKVLWAHLQRFGGLLNDVTELSQEAPLLNTVFVPLAGMGAYFISANNPVYWAIQSPNPTEGARQIGLLFHCEDVDFYQTDEMDVESIATAVVREAEIEEQARLRMEEEEEAKARQREEANRLMENLRKGQGYDGKK